MNKKKKKDDEFSPLETTIENAGKEVPFSEQTELGQVFDNLDNDNLNPKSNMSNIDFNSRLSDWEITSCLVFDELQGLGILPKTARITRQKKRLAVSKEGLGRREKVEIASASRSAELSGKSGGILSQIGSIFKRRE